MFSFSIILSQTSQDLQKMKSEYENYKKGQANQQTQIINQAQLNTSAANPEKANISPYLIELIRADSIKNRLEYFGYSFFTQRDTVSFWENLPTLPNYLLGPGDELIISLWGETQLRKNYVISREGSIYDEKVGLLNLSGKTIENSQRYLSEQFGRVFATLKGRSPSTFIDVSLGKLRSINVNFVGEVKYPGVYPLHPFSSVVTGLIQAGGVDTLGSLRNVIMKRVGEKEKTIDLYNYLLKGDMSNNIRLRDQDIIVVPPRKSTIIVDSSVVRPGIYESKPNESVLQMLTYAGGLKSDASTIIGLMRITPIRERKIKSPLIKNYYINYSDSELTKVHDGDILTVLSIYKTKNIVEIIGQVKKPGVYYYSEGLTAKELIDLSGGLEDPAFSQSVFFGEAKIIRRDANSNADKVLTFNLSDLLSYPESFNIGLENHDIVVIYKNKNFSKQQKVQLSGEVEVPGYYVLKEYNESLESVLYRAGGISENALKGGISIYRDKIFFHEPPEEKYSFNKNQIENINIPIKNIDEKKTNKIKLAWTDLSVALMPGDSIIVSKNINAIYVFGEVYNPGLIDFNKNKKIKYYLDSAGGINKFGDLNNVVVIYPNGIAKPKKLFQSPRIVPGSTIVVYKREDLTPVDLTDIATNIASVITSLVTVILLTKQI